MIPTYMSLKRSVSASGYADRSFATTDADYAIATSHVKHPAGRWLDCERVLSLQTGNVGPMLPMCRRGLPTLMKSERLNFEF